jgi:hypothetical protein
VQLAQQIANALGVHHDPVVRRDRPSQVWRAYGS